MTCHEIAALLDAELCLGAYKDVSNNGLQIENQGPITKVATAVDASIETFEAAAQAGAQMVIVHHGLSWGNSLARITGLNYRLVACALRLNLAVYGAHLPLDAHKELGNNIQLAKALSLQNVTRFLDYHGQKIGYAGELPEPLSQDAFAALVNRVVQNRKLERLDFGNAMIRTVGICSGGAPEGVEQAAAEGLDAYLCGEVNLVAYNLARQLSINAYFAGHYATERFGVKALGAWLAEETALPVEFIDFDLPY
ncbi:MAG: Nif3-like dinuclear metal center hexameric protein [Kiritimatiellae bacterium]|nr:Nif3-like dinuclear metal center hexameric protein [Kiritimatiellia bacterium]